MSNELFPFTQRIEPPVENVLPIFREVGWDFMEDIPLIESGRFKIVEGNDALKVWIYKVVKTERYKHIIYNDDFGTEINKYIGKNYTRSYTESEIVRDIKEALLINEYILEIKKINASYEGSTLMVHVELTTVYSDIDMEVRLSV